MRREPRSCIGASAGVAMRAAILKGVTYLLRRAGPKNFKATAQVGWAIPSILLERVSGGKPANGHQQPPGWQILTWKLDAEGYPDVICGEDWFRDLDSNQDTQLQRLMSYRLDDPGMAVRNCSRGMQAGTDGVMRDWDNAK